MPLEIDSIICKFKKSYLIRLHSQKRGEVWGTEEQGLRTRMGRGRPEAPESRVGFESV